MDQPQTKPRRRRWLSFSLRAFFVLLTALCVWLGFQVNAARRQREAVAALESLKAKVTYDFVEDNRELPDDGRTYLSAFERWLSQDTGIDLVASVIGVSIEKSKELRDEDLAYIADLPELEFLSLYDCPQLTDACLDKIPASKKLESVGLVYLSISDEAATGLRKFPNLKSIVLAGSDNITDKSVETIKMFPALERLSMGHTAVTDAGIRQIRDLKHLKELYLGNTAIGDAAMESIGELSNLGLLIIEDTEVTDAGLKSLDGLSRLSFLELNGSKVKGFGLRYVSRVEFLGVRRCPLDDTAVSAICSLQWLKSVELERTPLSREQIADLVARLPSGVVIAPTRP